MTYLTALIFSGLCWFGVAALLGSAIPILNEAWPQHLVSALITSTVVGYVFKRPIRSWIGWRWYVLPILTLFAATALFGLLVPTSWWLTSIIRKTGKVEGEAFYFVPVYMVFYALTFWLFILYPLALLTQTVLRKLARQTS